MTEELLQYLWHHKLIPSASLLDTNGTAVNIIDRGQWNSNAGADFLFAKIQYEGLTLVGHIELHLKSSDFRKHQHEGDKNYNNLVLHLVYEHDEDIPYLIQKSIPTVELKSYIPISIIERYKNLYTQKQFIPCEDLFSTSKIPPLFSDSILLKKLEEKSQNITSSLAQNKNDYEGLLFQHLAYAFGLRVNAEIFKQIAECLPFSIINKIRHNRAQLEALLFGLCGWLDTPKDEQMKLWQREFLFLKAKYQLGNLSITPLFLRLRPANFPTIRLSQLAHLYHLHQNLFSKMIKAKNIQEIENLFTPVTASEYWDTHYNFGKTSTKTQTKKLTKSFVQLIIINAILPIKYTYFRNQSENIYEEILDYYQALPAEKNTIITVWKSLGLECHSAKDTQAYLFLYKNFCSNKKCLNCGIGNQLLKS